MYKFKVKYIIVLIIISSLYISEIEWLLCYKEKKNMYINNYISHIPGLWLIVIAYILLVVTQYNQTIIITPIIITLIVHPHSLKLMLTMIGHHVHVKFTSKNL